MRLTHGLDSIIIGRMEKQNDLQTDQFCTHRALIPSPDVSPTISVPAAARLVGVSRRTGYAAAERGEWPVCRTGRAVRVRTLPFLELYGLLEAS